MDERRERLPSHVCIVSVISFSVSRVSGTVTIRFLSSSYTGNHRAPGGTCKVTAASSE